MTMSIHKKLGHVINLVTESSFSEADISFVAERYEKKTGCQPSAEAVVYELFKAEDDEAYEVQELWLRIKKALQGLEFEDVLHWGVPRAIMKEELMWYEGSLQVNFTRRSITFWASQSGSEEMLMHIEMHQELPLPEKCQWWHISGDLYDNATHVPVSGKS